MIQCPIESKEVYSSLHMNNSSFVSEDNTALSMLCYYLKDQNCSCWEKEKENKLE